MTNLNSSAPHIHDASSYHDLVDWGLQTDSLPHPHGAKSRSSGSLIWKTPVRRPEAGLWICTPGRWRLSVPRNEFLWLLSGQVSYAGDAGDEVTIVSRDAVMFPAGWKGEATVHEALRATYILSASEAMDSTPTNHRLLRDPQARSDLKDWGAIPGMIEGMSLTAGLLLHREADLSAECGFWTCTPGYWNCHVTRHEYCHFLEGRATYTHTETGEVIDIRPDTVALFPQHWKGTCRVDETVKKVYLIV
jgi:uncharacterized cupin superfamily protein